MAPKIRVACCDMPVLFFICFLSMADSGLVPGVEVLQGPSSRTTLLGPDGSSLSATAPGGTVVTGSEGSGLVVGAPVGLAAGPEIVVAGPAGSIATSHSLAGSAVIPAAAVASPLAVNSVLLGDIEGNEGAYVPDNTEQQFDDGSYKGEH